VLGRTRLKKSEDRYERQTRPIPTSRLRPFKRRCQRIRTKPFKNKNMKKAKAILKPSE
jgi:hypothetical protein